MRLIQCVGNDIIEEGFSLFYNLIYFRLCNLCIVGQPGKCLPWDIKLYHEKINLLRSAP